MPVRAVIEDFFVVEVFLDDEPVHEPLAGWRRRQDDSRVFAATVRAPTLGQVSALAVWPRDTPPPVLTQAEFPFAVRRDAIQFVQPQVQSCAVCGAEVDGLFILGRLWFGGNRRRHKMAPCPSCGADPVHSRLLLLAR